MVSESERVLKPCRKLRGASPNFVATMGLQFVISIWHTSSREGQGRGPPAGPNEGCSPSRAAPFDRTCARPVRSSLRRWHPKPAASVMGASPLENRPPRRLAFPGALCLRSSWMPITRWMPRVATVLLIAAVLPWQRVAAQTAQHWGAQPASISRNLEFEEVTLSPPERPSDHQARTQPDRRTTQAPNSTAMQPRPPQVTRNPPPHDSAGQAAERLRNAWSR